MGFVLALFVPSVLGAYVLGCWLGHTVGFSCGFKKASEMCASIAPTIEPIYLVRVAAPYESCTCGSTGQAHSFYCASNRDGPTQ